MAIEKIMEGISEITSPAGRAVVATVATSAVAHQTASFLSGLRTGTALLEEYSNPAVVRGSLVAGLFMGMASYAANFYNIYGLNQHLSYLAPVVVNSLGAAVVGGLAGAIINPVQVASTTNAGVGTNLAENVTRGASFGATASMLAYLVASSVIR